MAGGALETYGRGAQLRAALTFGPAGRLGDLARVEVKREPILWVARSQRQYGLTFGAGKPTLEGIARARRRT